MTNLEPDHIVDIRTLPGTRETTAYQDGGLFPVLALSNDGVAVAALWGDAGHYGRDRRMEVVRSLDDGLTWTPPNVVADSEDDDRNPAFGVSAEGTLILLYRRLQQLRREHSQSSPQAGCRHGDSLHRQ